MKKIWQNLNRDLTDDKYAVWLFVSIALVVGIAAIIGIAQFVIIHGMM